MLRGGWGCWASLKGSQQDKRQGFAVVQMGVRHFEKSRFGVSFFRTAAGSNCRAPLISSASAYRGSSISMKFRVSWGYHLQPCPKHGLSCEQAQMKAKGEAKCRDVSLVSSLFLGAYQRHNATRSCLTQPRCSVSAASMNASRFQCQCRIDECVQLCSDSFRFGVALMACPI